MFPSNLLKKPKIDSKRTKAIAFFNNKFPNSPVIEKSGFWTFNRVKILISVAFALIASWSIPLVSPKGAKLLMLLAYLYVALPLIWFRSQNHLAVANIKKTKFIKVASRVYRQSELPCGIVFSAIFTAGIAGIIVANFIANLLKKTIGMEYILVTILLLPFLMYHLLCFIGNHPLTIFTAIAHQTDKALAPYTRHSAQQPGYLYSSSNNSWDYNTAPNGISGSAGWSIYHRSASESSSSYYN